MTTQTDREISQTRQQRQQAYFNAAWTRLHAQGGPSCDGDGACLYRNSAGRACAVGANVPDEKYSKDMEGENIAGPVGELFPKADHVFLSGLQTAHDSAVASAMHEAGIGDPEFDTIWRKEWETEMRQIADRHCLTIPA